LFSRDYIYLTFVFRFIIWLAKYYLIHSIYFNLSESPALLNNSTKRHWLFNQSFTFVNRSSYFFLRIILKVLQALDLFSQFYLISLTKVRVSLLMINTPNYILISDYLFYLEFPCDYTVIFLSALIRLFTRWSISNLRFTITIASKSLALTEFIFRRLTLRRISL